MSDQIKHIHEPLVRRDFDRAHFKSFFYGIYARLSGGQRQLLPLEAVRRAAKPHAESYEGLRTIPIEKIVGSEGRYKDFDKRFMPRNEEVRARWERVDHAFYENKELPPIQVYEIGELYFVKDGNHRVSVARQKGIEYIDAEVIKLHSDVTLDPEKNVWLQLLAYERKLFYDRTALKVQRPACRIRVSNVGSYDLLIEHIEVHDYFRGEQEGPRRAEGRLETEEEILRLAAVRWYDEIYYPIVQLMREQSVMEYFPEMTEGDLYLWIMDHWHFLKQEYGPFVQPEVAVQSFKLNFGAGLLGRIALFFNRTFRKKKPHKDEDEE